MDEFSTAVLSILAALVGLFALYVVVRLAIVHALRSYHRVDDGVREGGPTD